METLEKVRINHQDVSKGFFSGMFSSEKFLKESGLPHSLLELIKTRASQINRCGYCLDMHHKDALKAGETFDRLYLLPAWEEAPCFTAAEKAVLNLTDVLTLISDHRAHDIEAAYERMSTIYTKEEIANVVLAICQINAWNRIAISFGTTPGSYQN